MPNPEWVILYLTGATDTELREFCEKLLRQGLAKRVELLDAHEMFINAKGKRKHTAGLRKMMVLSEFQHLDAIFRQLQRNMEAVAVPVLRAKLLAGK